MNKEEFRTIAEEVIIELVITGELVNINKKLDKIMANQADLDAAIADLASDIATQTAAIDAAVQSIINAIAAAGTPIDLSAEVASLQAAKTALDAVAGQLPTTPTP